MKRRGLGTVLPPGVTAALAAALLFGATTPVAKLLLGRIDPLMLAGLFYLGSGAGLTLWRAFRRGGAAAEAPLTRPDLPWLAGAVFLGGMVGPALLMVGIRATSASSASLLLNLEGVFTALLAWFVFRENFDRRVAAGLLAIVAGGLLLSWEGRPAGGVPWGALAVAGACFCWGLDNNLTQRVSGGDPVQVAAIKGLVAGTANLGLSLVAGGALPAAGPAALAGVVGLFGYGVSLTLFIRALRDLGTARTGAYFSLAPFVGAGLGVIGLRESAGGGFMAATVLMALGIWLHLTERHDHEHTHKPLAHSHRHWHDEHHQHEHPPGAPEGEPHTHWHTHERLTHRHPHYPDIHHRHRH